MLGVRRSEGKCMFVHMGEVKCFWVNVSDGIGDTYLKETMCLLLTEFEVRTVSYGPSFLSFIYGQNAKRAGHKSTGKTRIRNLQKKPRKRG